MNIIQIQNKLKGLPDNALMQALQTPNPAAPSFLVLTEIQRRKDMRNEYDARKAAAQKPLAESLPQEMMASQMPTAGIGTVPPQQGMPADAYAQDEVNMASGGITGYADEGLVRGPHDMNAEGWKGYGAYTDNPISSAWSWLKDKIGGSDKEDMRRQGEANIQKTIDMITQRVPTPLWTGQLNKEQTPETKAALEVGRKEFGIPSTYVAKPAAAPAKVAATGKGGAGITAIPKAPEPDTLENYFSQAEKLRGPSAVDAMKSEIMDQYGNIDKRLQQDKYMALAQAGFAMAASQNPSFFGSMGEGAKVGVGALVAAQDAAQKAKQGLLSSRIAMAQAEDARRDGNITLAQQFLQQAKVDKQNAIQNGFTSQQLGLMAKQIANQGEALKTKGGMTDAVYANIVDKVEKNLQNNPEYQAAERVLASPKADSVAKSIAQTKIDDLQKSTMQKYMRGAQGLPESAARPYTDFLKK